MNDEQALWANFIGADDLVAAARTLDSRGIELFDAFTPYPLPELDHALKAQYPVRLSRLTFFGACLGGALAFLIIWWTSAVDYPLNVGGRPLNSVVADIPIVFESSVLGAVLSAFAGFLWLCGLPRLTHPLEAKPGFRDTSVDRFWLGLRVADSEVATVTSELRALGALDVQAGRAQER